jgi:hypothetical protein
MQYTVSKQERCKVVLTSFLEWVAAIAAFLFVGAAIYYGKG